MARKFKHVSHSTGSDDGLWMAWDAENQTMCVIEFAHWADLDSSFDGGKYNVQCGLVDLSPASERPCNGLKGGDTMSQRTALENALACSGLVFDLLAGAIRTETWERGGRVLGGDIVCRHDDPNLLYLLAECYWRYGANEVWSDISGNNRNQMMRAARRELA
jgi:hypothetical protein